MCPPFPEILDPPLIHVMYTVVQSQTGRKTSRSHFHFRVCGTGRSRFGHSDSTYKKIMSYREWIALGTCGKGRTNGIYLLTNYVLTDKFCMEMMLIRRGLRNVYVNMNYVLSGVEVTGNHM